MNTDGPGQGTRFKLQRKGVVIAVASAVVFGLAVGGVVIATTRSKTAGHHPGALQPLETSTPASAPATTTNCPSWPSETIGMPAALNSPNPPPGVYLWDAWDGWHVRSMDMPGAVSGSMTVAMPAIIAVPEPPNGAILKQQSNVVNFSFTARSAQSGMHFAIYCQSAFTIEFRLNGGDVPVNQIRLGAKGVSPKANPISLHQNPGG